MNELKSVFPTMITPYCKDGSVDLNGVEALVEWYFQKGCDGIFADCQSSEIFFLTKEERISIATHVVKKRDELFQRFGRRMQIVASGHVSDTLEGQADELNAIAATGVDGIIFISNRFDIANTTDEKWIADMNALIALLPKELKLGVYECPYPYKRLLTPAMLEAIKATGRFIFIKDTCCNAQTIKERVAQLKGSGVRLLNANAQTTLETVRAGADGYSGVMANFHPELYVKLFADVNGEGADELGAFLSLAAFTESLAYPASAKYYLREHEGVPIEPYSRTVDCSLITEYQKSILRQMKLLGDKFKGL